MGTRYNQGDKVELAGSKAEVIGIRNSEAVRPIKQRQWQSFLEELEGRK